MLNQVSDQFMQSLKPANDLALVNAKMLETLANQQNELFTGVLNASMDYIHSVASEGDMVGLLKAQNSLVEDLQEQVVSTVRDSYAIITGAQEHAGEIMNNTFTDA